MREFQVVGFAFVDASGKGSAFASDGSGGVRGGEQGVPDRGGVLVDQVSRDGSLIRLATASRRRLTEAEMITTCCAISSPDRPYDRLRVTRNRIDYPSPGATLSRDDVREGILRAADIVDVAANVLPQLPVFTR